MLERIPVGSNGAAGLLLRPVAAPTAAHAAVVLLPAIAGINPYTERVAARLAQSGRAVVLLDYYARTDGPPDLSSPAKIGAAVASVADDQVVADVADAAAMLSDHPRIDPQRIGVLGFCIGGTMATLAATKLPQLACAIGYYGLIRYAETSAHKPRSPLDAVADLEVPLLGHWGETDHLVPLDDVLALREALGGKPAELYTYPGAGHAFHEDFRDVYRPIAAAESWARTERYLDWYLG